MVLHLTAAKYTGVTTCPRDTNGNCDFLGYLRSAYGPDVVEMPTSVHATLHSNAPRLVLRKAVESCSGAACAAGHFKITGDIASGQAA